jgi:hypothetical protein
MIEQFKQELELKKKGCNKSIQMYPNTPNVFYICGDNRLHDENDPLTLCPSCQASLKTFIQTSLSMAKNELEWHTSIEEPWQFGKDMRIEELNQIIKECEQ